MIGIFLAYESKNSISYGSALFDFLFNMADTNLLF